ncbi:alpha-1,6-mannosyltransferase [Friedmanniomyces endolithicus]|nr:alpha-1,6-mannosyltransferase [Friedmanniomyces endolithicus]
MSLDRSPSPHRSGGWSSPGLTSPFEETNGHSRSQNPSPGKRNGYGQLNGGAQPGVTWGSAKAKSARVNGYPSYQPQNQGFFGRHYRRLSESLPHFAHGGQEDRYAEKEKLGRGRSGGWSGSSNSKMKWRELPRRVGLLISRRRKGVALVLLFLLGLMIWFQKPLQYLYRRTSFLGGGSKFVIILAANQGGGVMEWKGPREWAIERDSVKNKKKYVADWGYELDIVDMSTKKRYAHEWRESWEKVDVIRKAMTKYPDAEWFWWLDLNTFIMEPSYSLQSHIFSNLNAHTYRDINLYNPLHIQHPPNGTSGDANAPQYANYLDPETLSPVGDGKPNSINLIVPQDCGGFNLGSFFVRRSAWTDRLLDIWWDPVFYEQKHMEWEHKEQDALEYIYTNQPWIRSHTAFIPQRMVNAFPNGACGDDRKVPEGGGCKTLAAGGKEGTEWECGIQGIHYQESERDFVVNMAGCEWGRDCWGEMYNFRQLSGRLNRSRWERMKDWWGESEEAKSKAKEEARKRDEAKGKV